MPYFFGLALSLLFIFAYYMSSVVTPFIVGAIMAYILAPAVDVLSSVMRRSLAILAVFFIISLIALTILVPIVTNIVYEVQHLPERVKFYKERLTEFYGSYRNYSESILKNAFSKETAGEKTVHCQPVDGNLSPECSEENYLLKALASYRQLLHSNEKLRNIVDEGIEAFKNFAIGVARSTMNAVGSLFSGLFSLALIPVIVFYLLLDGREIKEWLITFVPPDYRARFLAVLEDIDRVLGAYMRGQIMVCITIGVMVSLSLFFLDIDFAFIIGPIAGFANLVPYLGLVVGLLPAIIFACLKAGFGWAALWKVLAVIFVFAVIQMIDGFLLSPRIIGSTLALHPLMVMLVLALGGSLFGIYGLFFAIPVTGTVMVLMRHFTVIFVEEKSIVKPDGTSALL